MSIDQEAGVLLEALIANGGQLQPQRPRDDGLPSFIVNYEPGADRRRCRQIIAEMKASPPLLNAAVLIVTRRAAA